MELLGHSQIAVTMNNVLVCCSGAPQRSNGQDGGGSNPGCHPGCDPAELACKLLKKLELAEGFEPPTL
jgi:hypothetical protein